jgi:peroxin-14
MAEKQQEAQASALGDLQQELKSLKSILLSRRAAATAPAPSAASAIPSPSASGELPSRSTAASPSPFPGLANRPSGIPAWQLAPSSTNTNTTAPVPEKAKEVPVENGAPAANGVNGTA